MESFLEKTVKHLYTKYGDDISELCIVLPNRRAGLFLKTHFSNYIKRTFWSPEIYATEDFVALLAGLEIADSTTLLFELYETVKQVNTIETENFEEFSKWGQILLNDINEIDCYLVDASQLFGNLSNIKELETWSLNNEEVLTDFQKQYLGFWQSLGGYYFDFKKRLLDKHLAYQGLAYEVVAANVEERVNGFPWKKIVFAGFNALNKAEEQIIEKLLSTGKAEIIWDADSYYVNDTRQEAGKFIRKYLNYGGFKNALQGNTVFNESLLANEDKRIIIIGAAKNVAQAKVAGNLVADFQKKYVNLQNTALVLADENLLFPVLHSLPENLEDINVTMGYPLKNTPVAGYFDLVFDLHLNAVKLSQGREKYSFYHKDFLKLFNHPYSSVLLYSKAHHYSVRSVVKVLHDKNIVFASFNNLEKIIEEKQPGMSSIFKPLFENWKTPEDAIACIYYLIDTLKDAIIQQNATSKNLTDLELEYLFAFTKIIKRIQALMNDYPDSVADIKTLHTLFKQIVKSSTLPFYGEPLMGLQVMGMLETRTLDFENVILLSCNEDILPSGKTVNSFIPHELKRYFGLPTYADKDAIFAYHFYRLLQRAQNVYLIYNTESDALGSGEKSRFLTQLAYELPKINKRATIEEKLVSIPVDVSNAGNVISIEKTDATIEKLKKIAAYGVSPSLLNKYRNCSLQFYFHAIAGLREVEEVEETIGADVIGNTIHEVLETLYKPFIGKKVNASDIAGFKKQIEQLTVSVFEREYSKSEISYGKNLLTVKVAIKFINNFLEAEIKTVNESEKSGTPLIIKALEQPLEAQIEIDGQAVKLHGKADRIDGLGSLTRIIDYKTGLADNKELRLEEWSTIQTDSTLAKSFQLLMYALLYQKMNPHINENLVSGIITFRQLSAGLKTVKINNADMLNLTTLAAFEEQLKQLLSDLFSPQTVFKQTSNIENCEYCAFKGICNR
jgi:ATP-dependent helicase/nuclease subunit B